MAAVQEYGFEHNPTTPTYSPDSAPSGYCLYLFLNMKEGAHGRQCFDSVDDVIADVLNFLEVRDDDV